MVVSSSTGYFSSSVAAATTVTANHNPQIQSHDDDDDDLVNNNHQLHQPTSSSFADDSTNPEMFNLTTGMEMIGFPPKNLHHHQTDTNSAMWKGFFPSVATAKGGGGGGSGGCGPSYQQDEQEELMNKSSNFTVGSESLGSWHDQSRLLLDDSSIRCVFSCEGNERPSQGLSLSLSSTNPSSIGLQSFELRHHQDGGFYQKPMNLDQEQHMNLHQDGFFGKSSYHHQGQQFQMRSSKFLGPAQELLNEFCSLGTKQTDLKQPKLKKLNHFDDPSSSSSSSKKQPLDNLELLELQKRKTRLLSLLEEVDRRYRHYCDQMKAVVSSFESVAGEGSAGVYTALASKAMSRHFRCLRDGIVNQIKAAKNAMGEKDTAVPGMTRGETPRLRVLDQTLRQQRAFQQMTMMESHPWRPQRGLPERSVSVLRAWLFEHFLHPYPSDVDKHILARQTGLSRSQVSNWFINARVRLWKPMVEEMYLEELKERDENNELNVPENQETRIENDQKPSAEQLVRIDSECLSSIINNNNNVEKRDSHPHHHQHHQEQPNYTGGFGRVSAGEAFGAVEMDFSAYNHQTGGSGGVSYFDGGGDGAGGGGGGVSLTLGLQQHGGASGGVSLAFSPSPHNSLFYPRDHIDDCQQVGQFSILDGEGQNLPYRNLMGAQLLHDLV